MTRGRPAQKGRAGRRSPAPARRHARREPARAAPAGGAARSGGAAGGRQDDALLPVRDRGPLRAYVRDVVDSRRRLVGLFVPAFATVLLATVGPASDLQRTLQVVGLVALAVVVLDAVRLGAAVSAMARAEFPGVPVNGWRTGWYAFMRSHQPRRTRRPAPRVAPGRWL